MSHNMPLRRNLIWILRYIFKFICNMDFSHGNRKRKKWKLKKLCIYVYFFLFRISTSCEIEFWDNVFSSQGFRRPLLTFKSHVMPKKRHWEYLRKHSPMSVPLSPPTLGYYFFKIFVKNLKYFKNTKSAKN